VPRDFASVLKRNAGEMRQLEQGSADEFLKLLYKLRDDVRGRLAALQPADAPLSAFRLNAVLGEAEAGIMQLEAQSHQLYGRQSQHAVDMAVEHVGEELDQLARAFDEKPLEVTLDAARALADPAQQLLANHFDTSVKRYGLDLLNGVRQRLFIGMRVGDPYGQVVNDIAGERGPLGAVGRSNAERLVRTETSQAYGSAQHSGIAQAARQAKGLKKTWFHVGSYPCDVCMPLHGTERPLDGTWTIRIGKKTRKVAHAPAHPNCTCRVVAMKPSWRAGLQKLGYLERPGEQPAL
jgi:hypothetical protein